MAGWSRNCWRKAERNNTVEEFDYTPDKPGSLSGQHRWTPIAKESAGVANAATFR
jgi:hypothetical protein